MRVELLTRLAGMIQGRWGRWVQSAQANQPALRDSPEIEEKLRVRMIALMGALIDSSSPAEDQVRSLLAIVAVYLGSIPAIADMIASFGISAGGDDLRAAAMWVAFQLARASAAGPTAHQVR
jgi:hypothetical protein